MGRLLAQVTFLALVVTLVASNPGPRAYQTWLQAEITGHADLGASVLDRMAGFIGSAVATRAQNTTRTNLGVASVYKTHLAGNRITAIGIAGRFLLVSQNTPEEAAGTTPRASTPSR